MNSIVYYANSVLHDYIHDLIEIVSWIQTSPKAPKTHIKEHGVTQHLSLIIICVNSNMLRELMVHQIKSYTNNIGIVRQRGVGIKNQNAKILK
jgi:hypothetical protein